MINHEAVYNTHANAVSIRENIAYDINNEVVVLDESAISTEATRLQGVYDGQAYTPWSLITSAEISASVG